MNKAANLFFPHHLLTTSCAIYDLNVVLIDNSYRVGQYFRGMLAQSIQTVWKSEGTPPELES